MLWGLFYYYKAVKSYKNHLKKGTNTSALHLQYASSVLMVPGRAVRLNIQQTQYSLKAKYVWKYYFEWRIAELHIQYIPVYKSYFTDSKRPYCAFGGFPFPFGYNIGFWARRRVVQWVVRWCLDQGVTGSNPTAVSMSLCPWARHFTPNCSGADCPQYWVCKSLWK